MMKCRDKKVRSLGIAVFVVTALVVSVFWMQKSVDPADANGIAETVAAAAGEAALPDRDVANAMPGLAARYADWIPGQEPPQPVYRAEDPFRLLSPVEAMVRDAETIEQRVLSEDADGRPGWLRLVYAEGFKYPWLRVEERFRVGSDGSLDLYPEVEVSVASHVLARFPATMSEPEQEDLIHGLNGSVLRRSLLSGLVLVSLPEPTLDAVPGMIDRLGATGAVVYAEPDWVVGHLGGRIPNDPDYSRLWGMPVVSAPAAWEVTTGSRDIVVAVIDTGVDYRHEDLAGNMWINAGEVADGTDSDGNGFIDDIRGWNFSGNNNDPFDDNAHGTHVAGTVGAVGNNAIGITGTAWQVSIMPIKFLNAQGGGTNSDGIESIRYATLNGAHIINASWGGAPFSQALYDVIAEARDANVAFIAAAGNSNGRSPLFPAAYGHLEENPLLNVLSVGATHMVAGPDGPEERKAPFSEWGAHIGAPGVSIFSTIPGGSYVAHNGTSMAAPMVAGAVALMLSVNADTNAEDLLFWLRESADKLPTLSATVIDGARLNISSAILANTDQPIMGFHGYTFVDLTGPRAGNGIVNPGETIELTVTVGVRGPNPAAGVTARLSSSNPDVTISHDTITLGDFDAWERRSADAPFVFSVAEGTETPRTLSFQLTMEDAEAQTWQAQVEVPVFTSFDVSGIVRAMDGTPLANATVSVSGDRTLTAVTDTDGRYQVELTEGSYTIIASAEGKQAPLVRQLHLPKAAREIDFVLGSALLEVAAMEIRASLRPGESKQVELVLANTGTAPLDFELRPVNYAFEAFPEALDTAADADFAWIDIMETGSFLNRFETWPVGEIRFIDGSGSGIFSEWHYNMIRPMYIGFPFPFFDERFDTLRVSNSGWLSFTGYNRSASVLSGQPRPLPSGSRTENKIAFAWNHPSYRDFDPVLAGWTTWGDENAAQTMHYQQVDAHTFVLNWNRWASWIQPLPFRQYLSGQVVLKSDGTILIKYKSYEAQPGRDIGNEQPRTYVVGLQDGATQRGQTVVYRDEMQHHIRPGTVFRFQPEFGAPWLIREMNAGRIDAFGAERTIPLTLDASHLPVGEYATTLVIDNNGIGGSVEIPVFLTIDPDAPQTPSPAPEPDGPFSVRIDGRDFGTTPTLVSANRAFIERTSVEAVDFSAGTFSQWGPDDNQIIHTTVAAAGKSVRISAQGHVAFPFDYVITENTVMEFDYRNAHDAFSSDRLTVHGIGLADGNQLLPERVFQLLGDRRDWGSILDANLYPRPITGSGRVSEWQHFRIPVGQYYTGPVDRIVFVQHSRDAQGTELRDPDNSYRNVRIFEAEPDVNLQLQWSFDDNPDTIEGFEATRVYTTPGDKTIRLQASEGDFTTATERVIPVVGQPRLRLRINFQPEEFIVPSGYIADTGRVFADRGNGFSYGWNMDSRAQTRRDMWYSWSRNAQSDTLIFFGVSRYWEIAVPDGLYRVTVQSGSTRFAGSHLVFAEGELVLNASTTVGGSADAYYATGSRIVAVSDGRLTLTSGRNATTLNFVEIERLGDHTSIAPIADFTLSPQTGTAPLTVQFDSSASFDGDGEIVLREWSFGDGFASVGKAPMHTFHQPGRYDVALTVTDNDGVSRTVVRSVIVSGDPRAHLVITPPAAGSVLAAESPSVDYTIRLSDQPVADVAVLLAADPDLVAVEPAQLTFTAANFATPQTVTVSIPDNPQWPFGTFAVPIAHTLATTDPAYAGSAAAAVDVIVQGPRAPFAPIITLQPQSVQAFTGGSASFTAEADANPTAAWQWFHEGDLIQGATSATLTLNGIEHADAGDYLAVATNSAGATQTMPARLSVREAPTARAMAIEFSGHGGTETLMDFPVLVRLHEGIEGFGYNTFTDPLSGADLHFLADDLVTRLPHEIEVWNPQGVSTVWIRVPTMPPQGKTIIAQWGDGPSSGADASAVWSNRYRMVYHFGDTGDVVRDSGPFGFNGAVVNPVGAAALPGPTGFAYNFVGDYIDTGANAADLGIDGATPRTISFWIQHRGVDAGAAFSVGQSAGNQLWTLRPRGKNQLMNDLWRVDFSGRHVEFSHTTADTWVHFAVIYDGTESRVYANGARVEASRLTMALATAASGNLRLGSIADSLLDGLLASLRVADVARSADWISAEYATSSEDGFFARTVALESGIAVPVIVKQPASRIAASGSTIEFEVIAASTGGSEFTYQWYFNEAPLAGETDSVLELVDLPHAAQGSYRVSVTNGNGTSLSREAVLTVLDAPVITQQPLSQRADRGSVAEFSFEAAGSHPLVIQWYRDGVPIAGANQEVLSVPARLYEQPVFKARVSNAVGSVCTDEAALTVVAAPLIISQPRDASVIKGLPYAFSVDVEAAPAPRFQWYRNDQPLIGETHSVLRLPVVLPEMAGEYSVEISNSEGTVTSRRAVLTLRDLPSGPATRISIDGYQGDTVIRDFPVLVRLNQQIPGFRFIQFADRNNGSDLRFLHASIEGELPYEIDYWNDLGQSAVWVKVPEISPLGTEIIATWGNPDDVRPLAERDSNEVWDNGYKVVYHMDGSGTHIDDSTAHSHHGTVRNPTGERWVRGIVGRAYDFTQDYIDTPNAGVIGIEGARQRTVSVWVAPRRFNSSGIFQYGISNVNTMWSLRTGSEPNHWRLETELNSTSRNFFFDGEGEWVHLAAVYDGAEARVYANGRLVPESVSRVGLQTFVFNGRIGSYQVQPQYNFDGLIDEYRVANVVRSPDWIHAQWATVADPDFSRSAPLVRHDVAAPVIVAQPQSVALQSGNRKAMTVIATSQPDAPVTYQWYHNGHAISGANGPELDFANPGMAQIGVYHVAVTNRHGTTHSSPAWLLLQSTAIPGQWAGFSMDGAGWAETGSFLGKIFVPGSWVYLQASDRWVYFPEHSVLADGAWIFFPQD